MSLTEHAAETPRWSRRDLVRSAGAVASILLVGCVSNPFGQPTPPGQLFVENRTNFPKLIALSVAETTRSDDPIVHHRYRLPEWHAIHFEDVLEQGGTYDIRAFQPNAPPGAHEQLVLNVETCDQGDPSRQMDVSILASSNGPDVLTYGCDETYNEVQSLTYADPTEFERGPIDGTLPTPTPSVDPSANVG